MATPAQATPTPVARSSAMPLLALLAGWLIPGAGHLLLRKPVRALLLFVSIFTMFAVGIALQGKVYAPNTGDLLDILGFVGQLGTGLLFVFAHLLDWGRTSVQTALQDYGTKFIVVGGLLNIISAIDAHSLANGRKAS